MADQASGFGRGRGSQFGRGGAAQNNPQSAPLDNKPMGEASGFGRGRGSQFGRGGAAQNNPQSTPLDNKPMGEASGFGRGGGSQFGRGGGGAQSGQGNFGGGFDRPQNFPAPPAPGFNRAALDINFGAENQRQDTGESRPPPFAPKIRAVDDLFKEDAENALIYASITDDDEEVAISGSNIGHITMLGSWKDAGFEPELLHNIVDRAKYVRPRKIQAQTIPLIIDGRDVKGHAETGSGKTAAFILPIINSIMKTDRGESSTGLNKPSPIAIVVEPTRELCSQVYEQGRKFASDTGVVVTKAYGQYNVRENLREIQAGCDILCATTGRLKHFVDANLVSLDKLKFFVLDEADNLLENNFLDDVHFLLNNPNFPKKEDRQTLLFSATFPESIQKLSTEVLKQDSVMVSNRKLVSTNSKVVQRFLLVSREDKKDALLDILKKELDEAKEKNPGNPPVGRTLVFVRTKRDADLISLYLCGKEIRATTINGDRPQHLREKALNDFRQKEVYVLVSTDVCARGLDIKDLDHVINFDLPNDGVTYVHRIGRTGRIKSGVATSFFDEFDNNDCSLASQLVSFVEGVHQEVPEFLKKVAAGSSYGGHGQGGAAQDADDGW